MLSRNVVETNMCNGCISPARDLKDPGNVTGDSGDDTFVLTG